MDLLVIDTPTLSSYQHTSDDGTLTSRAVAQVEGPDTQKSGTGHVDTPDGHTEADLADDDVDMVRMTVDVQVVTRRHVAGAVHTYTVDTDIGRPEDTPVDTLHGVDGSTDVEILHSHLRPLSALRPSILS